MVKCVALIFDVNSANLGLFRKRDKFQLFMDKLAEQLQRKERKALSKSSSSISFLSPHPILIPISGLSPKGISKTHSILPGSSLNYCK